MFLVPYNLRNLFPLLSGRIDASGVVSAGVEEDYAALRSVFDGGQHAIKSQAPWLWVRSKDRSQWVSGHWRIFDCDWPMLGRKSRQLVTQDVGRSEQGRERQGGRRQCQIWSEGRPPKDKESRLVVGQKN